MQDLPMLRGESPCPAASAIAGADRGARGVLCRAMQQDIERDDGTELGMSAGQFGHLQHDSIAGVYLSIKSDPSTVVGLCHGAGLPVLSDEDHQARDHYSYCPVWQAEKDRLRAGGDRLAEEEHPEPVSMGFDMEASHEAADPWAAARADLELFA